MKKSTRLMTECLFNTQKLLKKNLNDKVVNINTENNLQVYQRIAMHVIFHYKICWTTVYVQFQVDNNNMYSLTPLSGTAKEF